MKPSYEELAQGLRDLMNYVGGWDEPKSHPCGAAADLLARIEGQGDTDEDVHPASPSRPVRP